MVEGWDFVGQADAPNDIWAEPEGGGYPILWWQLPPLQGLPRFSGGTGEPNDPYMISRPEELNSIGYNPRLMECRFKVVADLDLTGSHFYPIGCADCPYGGVFDGNGHTISHLTIKGEGFLGVFGYLASGAEVKDLSVVDVNITGSEGGIGGVVGFNEGAVADCYSTGTVNGCHVVGGLAGGNVGTMTGCHSTGTVSGNSEVGGLVGANYGTVTQCYSTGAVSGTSSVGGLVGSNNWMGTVSHCYSTGAVNGSSGVGGLVGHNYAASVAACFWDTQTSGQPRSDGGTGKTTVEMQTAKTFLDGGWDFVGETKNGTEDIWWILEGKDYPHLWWEAAKK
jgi:hypothetical protein